MVQILGADESRVTPKRPTTYLPANAPWLTPEVPPQGIPNITAPPATYVPARAAPVAPPSPIVWDEAHQRWYDRNSGLYRNESKGTWETLGGDSYWNGNGVEAYAPTGKTIEQGISPKSQSTYTPAKKADPWASGDARQAVDTMYGSPATPPTPLGGQYFEDAGLYFDKDSDTFGTFQWEDVAPEVWEGGQPDAGASIFTTANPRVGPGDTGSGVGRVRPQEWYGTLGPEGPTRFNKEYYQLPDASLVNGQWYAPERWYENIEDPRLDYLGRNLGAIGALGEASGEIGPRLTQEGLGLLLGTKSRIRPGEEVNPAGAYYSPNRHEMTFRDDVAGGNRARMNAGTYAHELMHAIDYATGSNPHDPRVAQVIESALASPDSIVRNAAQETVDSYGPSGRNDPGHMLAGFIGAYIRKGGDVRNLPPDVLALYSPYFTR